MNKFIPLSVPNFEGNEKKYVDDAIEQGWVSTGGSYISTLEKALQNFLNVENVAACQSGTSALHLSLIDAGVKMDEVVFVSPLTFIAAVNPIRYQHATPVFIDCDSSFCMDPKKLLLFCQNECEFSNGELRYKGKVVKAIIIVHVFGNLADMESIVSIASQYNLKIIEDATEALGSQFTEGIFKGKYAGTIGDYGAFSFNGNKIITTGGGGAVTSNNPKNVDHIKYLSTQAKNDTHFYIHNEIGYNYRMTNLQAALGVAQMEELPTFIKRKQANYELYKKAFSGFELANLVEFREKTNSNKWFYSLEIDIAKVKMELGYIVKLLEERGIQTRTIWGLINEQIPYLNADAYCIECAPYYANRILNLPCSTNLTKDEIIYVTTQIKDILSTGNRCC